MYLDEHSHGRPKRDDDKERCLQFLGSMGVFFQPTKGVISTHKTSDTSFSQQL